MWLRLSALLFWAVLQVTATQEWRPLLRTNYGKVRGHVMKSLGGREIYAFNGIPYAKPPLGDLRFRPPVSPSNYDGVLDASKDGEDCFQRNFMYNQYPDEIYGKNNYVGDEDCLYLNVYTPQLEGEKLPVMVFIHGGGFKFGSGASQVQGPQIFMDSDVVLVTLNYRLEVMGFLRADDTHLPGNLGLKDQSAALRWVKENIHHFNGDPDSITLFGSSAGAASVNFQLLAPRNKGLFQRAISQGGFVDCPWSIQSLDKAREAANTLASTLGCPTEPSEMRKCLQGKSILEIYQGYSSFEYYLFDYMLFKPVLENEVPGALITRKSVEKGSDIPWIIGLTSGEGLMFLADRIMEGDKDLKEMDAKYKEILPMMFYFDSCPNAEEVARKIKEFYLGDGHFSMENVQNVINMWSDGFFNHGFDVAGRKHKGKLYRYLFSHVGEYTFFKDTNMPKDLGVSHGDELHLQFYSPKIHLSPSLNEVDSRVSKTFIELWTNFAKYGDPTPAGSPVTWKESRGSTDYIEITTNGLKPGQNQLNEERIEFWENLHKSYRKHEEL